jgi:hypothetical protein
MLNTMETFPEYDTVLHDKIMGNFVIEFGCLFIIQGLLIDNCLQLQELAFETSEMVWCTLLGFGSPVFLSAFFCHEVGDFLQVWFGHGKVKKNIFGCIRLDLVRLLVVMMSLTTVLPRHHNTIMQLPLYFFVSHFKVITDFSLRTHPPPSMLYSRAKKPGIYNDWKVLEALPLIFHINVCFQRSIY